MFVAAIKIISHEYSTAARPRISNENKCSPLVYKRISISPHQENFSHFSAPSVQKILAKSGKRGRIYGAGG